MFKGEFGVRNMRARRKWNMRGRPSGEYHRRSDIRTLEYLVKLCVKHQIDALEFFNALVQAWENGEATCQGLTIKFRAKKKDSIVFLVMKGRLVVAQFPISEEILKMPDPLRGLGLSREETSRTCEVEESSASKTGPPQIKDFKAGMKGVSLKARVIEISKPKLVLTRFNEYALLANATLSDANNTIKVPLWNQRIQSISVNDKVQIENARVTLFRGEKQLNIGRTTTLRVVQSNSSHGTEGIFERAIKQ